MSSGVMRITVTVVVIMFELTGALTYILPTMVRISHYAMVHQLYETEFDILDCTSGDEVRWRLHWRDRHRRRSYTIQRIPLPG